MTHITRQTPCFSPHRTEIETLQRLDYFRGLRRIGQALFITAAAGGLTMSLPYVTALSPGAEKLWAGLFLALGGFGAGFVLWAVSFLVTIRAELDGGSRWERAANTVARRVHGAISVPALAGVLISLSTAFLLLGGTLFIVGAPLLGLALATMVVAFSDTSIDH